MPVRGLSPMNTNMFEKKVIDKIDRLLTRHEDPV